MRSSVDWKKKSMRRLERNDGGGVNDMEGVRVGGWVGWGVRIVCERGGTDDGRA